MDDILDLIQDFAETMYLYDVRQLTPEARQLSDIWLPAANGSRAAVVLLNKMDNAPAMLKLCRDRPARIRRRPRDAHRHHQAVPRRSRRART
jgi:uncharacterized protein Yka (UPF0111/DUF47 family)